MIDDLRYVPAERAVRPIEPHELRRFKSRDWKAGGLGVAEPTHVAERNFDATTASGRILVPEGIVVRVRYSAYAWSCESQADITCALLLEADGTVVTPLSGEPAGGCNRGIPTGQILAVM